ncbi:MAG TPA: hypothetical protein VF175_03200, partial [Lacipirellula sp.]
VHYADDCDAKVMMMMSALVSEQGNGPLTSNRNPLRQRLYRGPLLIAEQGAGPEEEPAAGSGQRTIEF